MTVADVGERAAAFDAAAAAAAGPQEPHAAPATRVGVRELIAAGQHHEAAVRWQELEHVLSARGLATVGDLPERERVQWARRLNALSAVFSHPDPPQMPADTSEAMSRETAVGDLESDDPVNRRIAVRRLAEGRRAASADVLSRVLATDPDNHVRAEAARGLGSIGGTRASAALLDVTSESRAIREAVADALGILGEPAGVPKLVAWLSGPGRAEAIRALGRIGDPTVVPELASCLTDESGLVRSRARRALVRLGDPIALDALRGNPRRNAMLRWFDVRASKRAIARRERRERAEVPPSLDRLTNRLKARYVKALLAAVLIAIIDTVALDAPVPIVLGLIVVVGSIVSLFMLVSGRSHQDLLDIARWRAESHAHDAHVSPWWSTILRTVIARPIAVAVFLSLPLAADAAMGGLGVLPGLVGALLVGIAASGAMAARVTAQWQAASGRTLMVERSNRVDALEDCRFFEMGPSTRAR